MSLEKSWFCFSNTIKKNQGQNNVNELKKIVVDHGGSVTATITKQASLLLNNNAFSKQTKLTHYVLLPEDLVKKTVMTKEALKKKVLCVQPSFLIDLKEYTLKKLARPKEEDYRIGSKMGGTLMLSEAESRNEKEEKHEVMKENIAESDVKMEIIESDVTKNELRKSKRVREKLETDVIKSEQSISNVFETKKSKNTEKSSTKTSNPVETSNVQSDATSSSTAKSDIVLPLKETKVKLIRKGRSVVDTYCPVSSTMHVYEDQLGIYDFMLNQTNIDSNNNKFYLVQILESDSFPYSYAVWSRWGRVGYSGQTKLQSNVQLTEASGVFKRKFREKTMNEWEERAAFAKHPGKYFMLDREFGTEEDINEQRSSTDKIPEPTLQPKLQSLMKMIFNKEMMNRAMAEIGYDIKRMPLGKLTKEHIQKGYDTLTELSVELNKPNPHRETIYALSSQFYTIIPHDFGFSKPTAISTSGMLKSKLQMLESLSEIEIATKLLNASEEKKFSEHPLDLQYSSLGCALSVLDGQDPAYEWISRYLQSTHASTHSRYRLNIQDIFEVRKEEEIQRFTQHSSSLSNHQLLWHGSRLTNYVGILSHGLKIAPPESPSTGYMFGKGIYFADMVSKSANYCFTNMQSNIGFVLLCQVALGEEQLLENSDYNAGDPILKHKKFHSTKGVGKTIPSTSIELDNVKIPMGPPVSSGKGNALLYNEYIVYNVNQVKMRYLIQVEFQY